MTKCFVIPIYGYLYTNQKIEKILEKSIIGIVETVTGNSGRVEFSKNDMYNSTWTRDDFSSCTEKLKSIFELLLFS